MAAPRAEGDVVAIRNTGVRYDLIARDSASRVFRTVGDSAARLEGGLGKLAKTVAYAGAALAGGLAVGLAESAKQATEFQTTMKRIQTQAGATAKDVSALSGQVLNLAKSTQQGPQALAAALYHLKSVGMDNADAMKSLKVASDLAAVGGSDLEETTNALAGAWRSGIRGADTFGKAASSVNAIIGAGNMTMQQFTEAIGTGILPSAKSFGLSLNQVGAALALMTDEGIPAVDAATRLRMSFSLLGAPSAAAEKQLKKIGLTGLDLAKAMRGPDGIIGAVSLLKDHLDKSGLSAAQQSQILSRAFGGGRSSSGILTLVNNLDVLRKKQDQVNSSMGKYGPAVAAQRKTVAAQLGILKSNLDVFAIQVGTKLLPPITSFVTYLNKTAIPEAGHFSAALMRMMPVDQIESGFSAVTGFIGDFFSGLNPKKKPTITLPAPTIKAPATTIPNSLRRPDLIVPSPTLRVGTTRIPSTLKAPAAVKTQATKLGEQLRAAFSGGLNDAIGQIDWGKLGKRIGDGLGTAFEWVTTHGADLSKRLAKAIGAVDWVNVGKSLGTLAVPLAIGFIDNLFAPLFSASFWRKHWLDAIIAAISVLPVSDVFGAVSKGFGKLPWGRIGEVLDHVPWARIFAWPLRIGSTLGDALSAAGQFVARLADGFGTAFAAKFPRVAQFFYEQMLLLPVRLGDIGRMLRRRATDMVSGIGDALVRSVPGMGNRFIRAAMKVLGRFTFYQTGINLVQGLLSGVGGAMSGIGKWINAHIVSPFVTWVKSLFGIHSPSTVFAGIGGQLVAGLKVGVLAGIAGVGKWLYGHVISPVLGAFSGAEGWLYGRGSALVGGLKSGAWSIAKGVGGWFTKNVVDRISGAFSGVGSLLTNSGGSIVSGLVAGTWEWLSQRGHDFVSWAHQIKDKIVNAITDVFKIGSPSKVMMEYGGWIVAGLQHGMLQGKDVLHATVKGLFKSPLDAAASLAKAGVQLPAKWAEKLLSAKAPQGKDVPLSPNVASAQSYAAGLVSQLWPGNAKAEMDALRSLWMAESGWRANAENMSSGAYGIPQSLPANKMASAGSDWKTNAATQIRWGLGYISGRYGDPITAWESWNAHRPHWYAAGGLAPIGQTAWVGERGPELMQVTSRGTRIYSNRDSMALAGALGMQVPGYASGTVRQGRARSDVAAAQRRVDALEREISGLRHAEATAHSRRQRKRDQLAIQAAEEELKAARRRLAAANKELSNANAQAKRVQSVANTLQNGFLKALETGSASAIASAVKSMNSRLQTAGFGRLVPGNLRIAGRLESLANQRASIQSRIAAARQFASDQSAGLGDFLSITGTGATNISDLIGQMRTGQGAASRFAAEVSRLSKAGLSKTLLSQLAQAGPGSQLASVLAGASPADIKQLNKAAAAQDKLTTSFGRSIADAMYDSGKDAGKGFLAGLMGQEKQIQAEMNKLAAGMVNTIKKALGIKSPSTVFRDQVGRQVALGAAVGVRQYAPHAVREAQRMADTMAAVRARTGGGSRPAAAGGTTAVAVSPVVHVHFSDPKLRDLIRVEVENGHVELTEALRAGGAA